MATLSRCWLGTLVVFLLSLFFVLFGEEISTGGKEHAIAIRHSVCLNDMIVPLETVLLITPRNLSRL